MKEIKTNCGNIILVDDDVDPYVFTSPWCITNGYPCRTHYLNQQRNTEWLHYLILPHIEGKEIDHINRNKLDNRKENLRYVTHTQNAYNQGLRKNNNTGYKGVSYNKRMNKWKAAIQAGGKPFHLGYFDSPNEAAIAYNIKAKEVHGEHAYLNQV